VLFAIAVVIVATVAARWINPLTTTGDIKSDEATYVSMALSLAHDGNLSFEKADLDRFLAIYPRGPEGIFLKREESGWPTIGGPFPYVHLATPVPTTEHLAYGKPFIYPLVAAPFVAIGGVGGMLILNLALIGICTACAVRFAQAQTGSVAGVMIGIAFVGASVLPVYTVWLMPELFNVGLIFVAYFLWLYKRVAPTTAWAGWRGPWTDVAASVLIGVAIYSKPNHVLMIGPPVLVALLAKQWRQAIRMTVVAAFVSGGLFAANLAITGEGNYQGSIAADGRKEIYDAYPFDANGTQFDTSGAVKNTTDTGNQDTTTGDVIFRLLPRNLWYFVAGRDAGLLPFFFPGLLIGLIWLARVQRATAWQAGTCLCVVASVVVWLVIAPYTWNGGGGAPGNRYILSTYPLLLFLLPQGASGAWGLVAAAVGLVFTGPMTSAPLESTIHPWRTVERKPFTFLPVELTLLNDLPLALTGAERWRIQVSDDPVVFVYYVDANAFPMEGGDAEHRPHAQWIAGDATADIIFKTETPLAKLTLDITGKYVANDVTVSLLGETKKAHLDPGARTTMVFTPSPGVWYAGRYAEVLRISTTNGFVPANVEPAPPGRQPDTRFLGVFVDYHVEVIPPGR